MANWQRDALCAGMDVNLFFQADTNRVLRSRLRRVCALCPVRKECYRENLGTPYGFYAGLSWNERIKILKKMGLHVTREMARPGWNRVQNGKMTKQ